MMRMVCIHCNDQVGSWECDICKQVVVGQCQCCHNELKHGVIKNQNIHIIGAGSPPGTDTIDGDPDAWAPSWKVGN